MRDGDGEAETAEVVSGCLVVSCRGSARRTWWWRSWNEPSFGVGAELVLAAEASVPILALHQVERTVSRFMIGYLGLAGATVSSYVDEGDLEDCVSTFLKARATRPVGSSV